MLEQLIFIGREQTASIRATVLPHRTRWRAQISKDDALLPPDVLRNGRDRPALAVQGPGLCIKGLSAGRVLGCTPLYGPGRDLRCTGTAMPSVGSGTSCPRGAVMTASRSW
jgi:hypothetical protein